MRIFVLPALLLAASLSPALTFAALWQTKEWRIDRLKEHLLAEGWFRQLFGIVRPAVVLVSPLLIVIPFLRIPWYTAGLTVLAAASAAQLLMHRQRMPVWTMKAKIIVLCSLLMNIIAGYGLLALGSWEVILLPVLQPCIIAIAWAFLLPVDRVMKRGILRRAQTLRERYPNAIVVGITGSVGKTTTKELLAHILQSPTVLATPAYVNSEMGVAQWLLRELPKFPQTENILLIVEMGAYRTGEIATLCRIAQPQTGVLTFVGSQHVALFGSEEKLLNAKSELIAALPETGRAFVNADCSPCLEAAKKARCAVVRVSTGGHADVEAHDIEETSEGIRFTVDGHRFDVPLHGTHNVTNVLLAIAVAEHLGISREKCTQKLLSFQLPHSTFTVRTERGVTILDDTHNSSPASFRAAIAWAKSQPTQRKILLTPGIIELGEETDRIHTDLGAAARGIVHRVIFTGKRGREAFARGYGSPVEHRNGNTAPVTKDSLLLCIGRIPPPIIDSLLPPA
ncbi:UDP-N-acetylmuramoyl-tripeptide--D-alanyl-D-alanine ligase [Candidatus Peregrinibacteria bacterium]|nr:UDP-N-acetylmuramoyl-tripeptide--D-alanyl-D-alanine ligase [Candidatus Peregrinibacteria bacterium]